MGTYELSGPDARYAFFVFVIRWISIIAVFIWITAGMTWSASLILDDIYVREFHFTGNIAVSDQELAAVCTPYQNRRLSFESIQTLRQELIRHYIKKGFVNSGVIIPDQTVTDGVITFQIKPGRLADVEISGNSALDAGYIRHCLKPYVNTPLNIHQLRTGLQILEQEPDIEKIHAHLGAGPRAGQAILGLNIIAPRQVSIKTELSNDYSPSIGALGGRLSGRIHNLTGRGDRLSADFETTMENGLSQFSADYAVPIIPLKTGMRFYVNKSDTTLVEDLFEHLDIESDAISFELGIDHRVYQTATEKITLGIAAGYKKSETYLLGEPFSFSEGPDEGESRIALLLFHMDWSRHGQNSVLAVHSSFNLGLDTLGATDSESKPDGQFLSWITQLQYIQRTPLLNSTFVFKLHTQLSNDALLPLEQFAIGGLSSVRGYRKNEKIGDNGVAGTVALRFPVYSYWQHEGRIEVEGFWDAGKVWNKGGDDADEDPISGIGLGIRWAICKNMFLQMHYAKALKVIDHVDSSLQDNGFYFRLTAQF